MIVAASSIWATEQTPSDPASGDVLLLDSLGRPVKKPVDSLPQGLRPQSQTELKYQTPTPQRGRKPPEELQEKLESIREGLPAFEWFPAAPPSLMPYLYSQDAFGNTVARPGPLIDVFPFESLAQGSKTWSSERGLRYSLAQTFTYSGMTDVLEGANNLGNYNLDLAAKWTLFDLRGDRGRKTEPLGHDLAGQLFQSVLDRSVEIAQGLEQAERDYCRNGQWLSESTQGWTTI